MSVGALPYPRPVDAPSRSRRRSGPPRALLVCVAVFLLALTALLLTHRPARLALPRAQALATLRADPSWRRALADGPVTRIDVMPFDPRYDHVDVYDGARMVFTVDVSARGGVAQATDLRHVRFAMGNATSAKPWLLALLCLAFVVMTGVWPVFRMRNLDVSLTVSLVASVILYNDLRPEAFVLASYPALAYLACRCAWLALGPPRPERESVPIFDALTSGLGGAAQRRLQRLGLAAASLALAMVGLSSLHVLDVGYAVMEGATDLLHGVLPYGHIPDVLHGDTYPIGSYLLYTPLAALTPVHDVWQNADLTLAAAVLAAWGTAWGLTRFRGDSCDERRDGPRAAIAWLCFPALLTTVSTGTTDVALGAIVLAAVVLWLRPATAAALLTLGGWFKLAPALLLPVALGRSRGRELIRPLLAVLAVSVSMMAALIGLGGLHAVRAMLHALSFQQSRATAYTMWGLTGSAVGQAAVEAAVIALVAGATLRLRADEALARDRIRVAALFAAVLLGAQMAASYWSFLYLAWVVPCLCLVLTRRAGVGES